MDFQDVLKTYGHAVEKSRHAHVFSQGDDDNGLYLIRSGALKAYYVSEDGKEFVKSFLLPGESIGSLTCILGKGSCTFGVVCLEDSVLTRISGEDLIALSREHLPLANAVNTMLLDLAHKKERREYEFLCLSAEERYRRLMERSPALFETVTQNDIARYLGITPVALSRIKKRVEAEAG